LGKKEESDERAHGGKEKKEGGPRNLENSGADNNSNHKAESRRLEPK